MSTRQPLESAPADQFRSKRALEAAGERFRSASVSPSARGWLKRAYHAALMIQSGGRGLRCQLPHGEVVRALPEHRHLSWNPTEYEAFRAAVEPGTVALDVGANVGAYAMLLGRWVGGGGRVFAFEPAPGPFNGLARHIALNHLDAVVQPIQAAVGSSSTTAMFLPASTAGEGRLATEVENGPGAIAVPVLTIDAFCLERRITPRFIKIDVEGAELAVLKGARDTIRRCGSDLALFVEMHPSVWPLLGTTKHELLAELDAQSLEPVALASTPDMWAVEGMCLRLKPCR
jgi:FkbM family methyltransferase